MGKNQRSLEEEVEMKHNYLGDVEEKQKEQELVIEEKLKVQSAAVQEANSTEKNVGELVSFMCLYCIFIYLFIVLFSYLFIY